MGINSFEVGAVFTIKDQSTAILREMAAQIERIETLTKSATQALTEFGKGVRIGGLVSRMNALGESMTTVAAKSAELKSSFASDFETINAGLFSTVTMARELAAAMSEVGAAGVAMSRSVAGASGGGGGGGGGGGRRRSMLGRVGAMGVPLGGMGALAAGVTLYGSMKGGAELDQYAKQTLINLGIDPDSDQGKSLYPEFMGAFTKQSTGTIVDAPKVAESYALGSQVAGYRGGEGAKQLLDVGRFVTITAELAKQDKLADDIADTSRQLYEFTHMVGEYGPDDVRKRGDEAFAAAKFGGRSLKSVLTGAQYFIPLAKGLGIDPDESIKDMGYLFQQGFSSQRTGTGIRSIVLSALGKDINTPLSSQLASVRSSFEHELNQRGEAHHSARETTKDLKMKAYRDVGLVDESGRSTLDDNGRFNMKKLFELLQEFGATHKDRVEAEKQLATIFDKTALPTMSNIAFGKDRYDVYGKQFTEYMKQGGTEYEQKKQAEGQLQQWQQLEANTFTLFSNLGNIIGGLVNPSLMEFNKWLGSVLNNAAVDIVKHMSNKDPDLDIHWWTDMKSVFFDNNKNSLKNTFSDEWNHDGPMPGSVMDKIIKSQAKTPADGAGSNPAPNINVHGDIHVHDANDPQQLAMALKKSIYNSTQFSGGVNSSAFALG